PCSPQRSELPYPVIWCVHPLVGSELQDPIPGVLPGAPPWGPPLLLLVTFISQFPPR
ncbi:hypothetical protein NDU88_007040, partial [Pleurodeles waltl]